MPEDYIFKLYQLLGSFFTGSHRTTPLYIVIAAIFIILIPISICNQWIINESVLNAVFSSITQGLIGFVAILGALSIYRLDKVGHDSFEKTYIPDYVQKFTVFTFFVALVSLLMNMFVSPISEMSLAVPALYLIFFLTARSLFMVAKGTAGFLFH